MAEPTVFIVDDDAAARNTTRRLIASIGLQTRTYRSAREFLDDLDATPAGCVVSDIRMPQMSGLELHQQMRRRNCCMPIIFVTGYADVTLAVSSMKAGAIDFLEKPVHPQVLLDAVQSAIARDMDMRSDRMEQGDLEVRLARLTPRESEVLELVVTGHTSNRIARQLGISPKTIHAHRAEIMAKMDAGSVADLVRMVVRAETRLELT